MFPDVPVPGRAPIRRPVELKLKPGWRYQSRRRAFTSESGEVFSPRRDLPAYTRIVYQVPELSAVDPKELSQSDRELQLHMHVVLPPGESPEDYVGVVLRWPCVAEASAGPEVSLPSS